MGGKKCVTDEERKARRKAASLRYYYKNRDDPEYQAKAKIYHKKASLAYYYRNKEISIAKSIQYNKGDYHTTYNENHRKYYWQQKLNDVNCQVPGKKGAPRTRCKTEEERQARKKAAYERGKLKKRILYWENKLGRTGIMLIKKPKVIPAVIKADLVNSTNVVVGMDTGTGV